MLDIVQTTLFNKQLKKCRRRGLDFDEFGKVVGLLQRQQELPPRYHDHALSGNRAGLRDCHIKPDWVLIYEVREAELVLLLVETGSHSDLSL